MSDPYAESAERFARDAEGHELHILQDDGLYRHLKVTRTRGSFAWFELITWPGKLAFVGNGCSFVFSRLDDMFQFFRSPGGFCINPSYWSEKLVNGQDAAESYSSKLFHEQANEALAEAEERYPGVTAAWKTHLDEMYDVEFEENARDAIRDFSFLPEPPPRPERRDFVPEPVARREPFRFVDTWEWDLKDYDGWFLWACHAIVWAIGQYDEAKKPSAVSV